MARWHEFVEAAPELAEDGERLLLLRTQWPAGLAYLATVRKDGGPRIHPISPVLRDGRLYAFVLKVSPKRGDLLRGGRYAMHSFPHPVEEDSFNDEEFYITGRANLIDDPAIRQAVAGACGDPVESGDVFELSIERAMHKGRRHGAAVYTKWKAHMGDQLERETHAASPTASRG